MTQENIKTARPEYAYELAALELSDFARENGYVLDYARATLGINDPGSLVSRFTLRKMKRAVFARFQDQAYTLMSQEEFDAKVRETAARLPGAVLTYLDTRAELEWADDGWTSISRFQFSGHMEIFAEIRAALEKRLAQDRGTTTELVKIERRDLYRFLPNGHGGVIVEDLAARWQAGVDEHLPGSDLKGIEFEWVDRVLINAERVLNKAGYSMSDRCREDERAALSESAPHYLAV